MRSRRIAIAGLFLALLGVAPAPERGRGVVAADHHLASAAGADMLAKGGNAVDAAVAAALAAGVVQPSASGLGGGGFAMVGLGAEPTFVDFREVAPKGVDPTAFADGRHSTREGGRAVAVPSESRGLYALLERWGRLSPDTVAAPAERLARDGFPAGSFLVEQLEKTKLLAVSALWGRPAPGEWVRNPALARTIRRWASSRGEDLHVGVGAVAIAAAVAETGGGLQADDLAVVRPRDRPPVAFRWAGRRVLTAPPPSSGGVVLATVLRATEGRHLAGLGAGSSAAAHVLTEAMKHAYADRAEFLGDPDFVDVPLADLLSDAHVAEVAAAIVDDRTFPPAHYGLAARPPDDAGTQHIAVIDGEGGAVALTSTINTGFGSGVVVRTLGLVLNNQMDDFAVAPGVPNAYGLVGNARNAVAPGKRPLSSMSPTLVYDDRGQVEMAVGASGGAQIPSSVVQVLVDVVLHGLDAQEAVAAPRFHHQWRPDVLVVEPGISVDVRRALEARGHHIEVRDLYSCVQVARRTPDGVVEGGSDPRKGGWPAAIR